MIPFSNAMRRTRPLLTVALICAVSCVAWRVETPPSAGSPAASRLPSRVRIETRTGQLMILSDPEIRGDTLFGVTDNAARAGSPTAVGVAIADLRRFEARRPSPSRSAVMGLGIVVGTTFVLEALLGGPGS